MLILITEHTSAQTLPALGTAPVHSNSTQRELQNSRGVWEQTKATSLGQFTDNDLQQIEGSFDKILGMLQEQYGSNCFSLVRERYGEKKGGLMK